MTTATQQLPSNPALDFANMVLAETNNALELIDILHDIAQGIDEDANSNDRITATNILLDRGLGKCPRQVFPDSRPDPKTDDNDVGALREAPALRESPSAVPHKEPESPRLVTQIDHSLNDSLGPAPSACPEPSRRAHTPTTKDVEPAPYSIRGAIRESPEHENADTSAPFDPSSIHITIQQHILAITNNGRTLFDTLAEIARAKDGPKAKSCHRARAARILIDRILGTNTAIPRSAPRTEPAQVKPYRRPVRYVDPVALAKARAEIQRMKDEGILTPDPTRPKIDISSYLPPDDFDLTPYAKEEAAAFLAEVNLRIERQKQWPEIEERIRKKLAQIYPSHSDDGPPNP